MTAVSETPAVLEDITKPLTSEEIGVFLDRLRAELGREPSPEEVAKRVLDPRDDFDKRAQLSFELNPEQGHWLYLVAQARQFIRREKRPYVVIADGTTVEIPRSVSDPMLRGPDSDAPTSYVTVEVTDAGELSAESRAAAGRYLRRELVSRVRANEAFLRDLGVWAPAERFVKAVEKATAGYVTT